MNTAELLPAQIEIARLQFRGPDALNFLQGQLSNDMATLGVGGSTLAGLHNPQGRVIALLELARPSAEEVLALLPAELAEIVSARLRRFLLRSRVTISRDPANAPPLTSAARADRIGAGIPQVYQATSEQFVAQMLNLDLIQAISFTKGCYTGQEVIARAHYRGRVKRRMQRFVSTHPCALAPGESHHLKDGRSAQIVDAVALADGRTEFLAVAHFGAGVTERGEASPKVAAAGAALDCTPLPLPYALPE